MTEYITRDSGQREEFSTGSKRDSRAGKGRYDLITPYGLKRVADVYERGAIKYDSRNWEKGQPLSRFLDSANRHLQATIMGHTDEDHPAQAAWNLLGFMHVQEMIRRGKLPKELDDLPHYESEPFGAKEAAPADLKADCATFDCRPGCKVTFEPVATEPLIAGDNVGSFSIYHRATGQHLRTIKMGEPTTLERHEWFIAAIDPHYVPDAPVGIPCPGQVEFIDPTRTYWHVDHWEGQTSDNYPGDSRPDLRESH